MSKDNAGRNYQAAVPLKTAPALKITSSVANVFDPGGNQIHAADQAGFQPATPAEIGPVTYTLDQKQ
ncbi:MAG TPA: hypothetical protein VGS58_20470 [Candidatus Sulfopaludibacter sp.]|nr:hypothetical protein [Candidatus Sulfopaludibacter sp.]